MNKYLKYLIAMLFVLAPVRALAFCPVCTVAVAAGLGLSRWLHVDDTISGLWIGALLMSSVFWFVNWLNKKKINFTGLFTSTLILTYGLVVIPLYRAEIIGHPLNTIFGIDKLIFGLTIGSILFILGLIIHAIIKKANNGKQLFYFQKVVSPMVLLAIFSLAFYFITKNMIYGV